MLHVTATKIFEFAYAHRLPSYRGKCGNMHGHTAKVEITVAGVRGEQYPGITADFHEIKDKVGPLVEELDHKCLNDVVGRAGRDMPEYFEQVEDEEGALVVAPTAENMVRWFKLRLEQEWPEADVVRIRFWESPSSCCEWSRSG
ncbi:MAG: 6-carboxytetrahydropterin synthase [Desulfovibrio sp.]|jgi:6-pyruvoyltetrahydropterin/6-carboxytetrahydropterin synthase|nr:6-carboxytetrahydropterin synthase [Desulfovibrio sp.]